MEINIQLVSGYNNKTGKAGIVYELNLMKNGKILKQNALDYKELSFDFKGSKDESFHFLKEKIEEIVKDTKEKYDCEGIRLFVKNGAFGIKRGMFYKDDTVSLRSSPNPSIFKEKTIKVYQLTANNKKQTHEKKVYKKPQLTEEERLEKDVMERRQHAELGASSINDFFTKRTAKNKILKNIFKKRVLDNNEVDEVFLNFVFITSNERKRYGNSMEIYKSEKDLILARDPMYREMNASLGETFEAVDHYNEAVIAKLKSIAESGKKIKINTPKKDTYLYKDLIEKIDNNNLTDSVEFVSKNSPLFHKTKSHIEALMQKDVELHLSKLKDSNTVAIFTDGSINKRKKIAGSGILIKLGDDEFRDSFTTKNKADSAYAEYRAVKEALSKVALSNDYKDKEIVIVSDKDSIAANIKKCLRARGDASAKRKTEKLEKEEPFLKDICDIIKHFDLEDKLFFHNVKSHLHDNNDTLNKDTHFDFYYNNEVDELARKGAMLKSKEEIEKIQENKRLFEENQAKKTIQEQDKNKEEKNINNNKPPKTDTQNESNESEHPKKKKRRRYYKKKNS